MPRNPEQIEFMKKQAIWFQVCSKSHQQFCNCGDWIFHLKKYLWPMGTTEESTTSVLTTGGKHVVDRFIVAGGGDGFLGKSGDPDLPSIDLSNKG